jgi:hypothetical protein
MASDITVKIKGSTVRVNGLKWSPDQISQAEGVARACRAHRGSEAEPADYDKCACCLVTLALASGTDVEPEEEF